MHSAIDAFFLLDPAMQTRVHGWHPDSIKSDREAKRSYEEDASLFPVLMMTSKVHRSHFHRPICQFDEIAADDRNTATLYIAAGSSKAEVLRAMGRTAYANRSLLGRPDQRPLEPWAKGGRQCEITNHDRRRSDPVGTAQCESQQAERTFRVLCQPLCPCPHGN